MSVPEPRSPLAAYPMSGRHGADGPAPVAISEVRLALVQVQARKGRTSDVAATVETAFGVSLPPQGRFSRSGEVSVVCIAPETWIVTAPFVQEGALAARLEQALGGLAAVTDQTHGKTAIRVSGPMAASVLDKGCRIDLHPRAFAKGHAAVTPIDHVTVVLAQTDDAPTYYLIVPSTLVQSLVDWLTVSAAEFGYALSGP